MAKTKKGKKNSRVITVDMSNTEGSSRVPEGDYAVRVKDVEVKESQEGNPYLQWNLVITEGKHEGKTLRHITSLQSHALFNLRNTLEAADYPVPNEVIKLDLDELAGLEFGVSVEIEEYQGKGRSRVVDVFSLEELIDDDEEDEEDEEEDKFEDYTLEDLEEMDDEELVDAAAEYDLTPVYTGKGSKKKLNRSKTIQKILDAIDYEDI